MDKIMTTVEPHLLDKVSFLPYEDLCNVYVGFTNSDLTKEFKIKQVLEERIIEMYEEE